MHLPAPGDLLQLFAAVPRLTGLLDDAEHLLRRAHGLVDAIDGTRARADEVAARTAAVLDRAERLVGELEPLQDRLRGLLDALEPPLTRLRPTLDRLAETTAPHEVDALVELIDHLPSLARKMETDIVPVLDSLSSVAPDLHDLLEVSRELNAMLAQIPGISRMKKRIDAAQAEAGRG